MTELIAASSASVRLLLVSSCTSSTRSYSTLSTFYLHQRLSRPCSSLTTGTRLHKSVVPLVSRVRAVPQGGAFAVEEEDDDEYEDENVDGKLSLLEEELGFDDEVDGEGVIEQDVVSGGAKVKKTFRLLGNKEKKELRAYAHSLGNDICLHQVFPSHPFPASILQMLANVCAGNSKHTNSEFVRIFYDSFAHEVGHVASHRKHFCGLKHAPYHSPLPCSATRGCKLGAHSQQDHMRNLCDYWLCSIPS